MDLDDLLTDADLNLSSISSRNDSSHLPYPNHLHLGGMAITKGTVLAPLAAESAHSRARLHKLRQRYAEACDKNKTAPSSRVMKNITEEALPLANLKLADPGVKALASSLAVELTDLDLSSNCVTDIGAMAIAAALKGSAIRKVDLSYNLITSRGAEQIAKSLASSALLNLSLSQNRIDDDFVKALASLPSRNDSPDRRMRSNANCLGALNISGNRLTPQSGPYWYTYLTKSRLKSLYAGWNNLSSAAVYLALGSGGISNLDLSFCGIADEDGARFGVIMAGGREADDDTRLGEYENIAEICKKLDGSIEVPDVGSCGLEYLDLSRNRIGMRAAKALAAGVGNARNLKTLKLGWNPLTTDGVRLILKEGRPGLAMRIENCSGAGDEYVVKMEARKDLNDSESFECVTEFPDRERLRVTRNDGGRSVARMKESGAWTDRAVSAEEVLKRLVDHGVLDEEKLHAWTADSQPQQEEVVTTKGRRK